MSIDETDLQNYLLKCELQYRANHTEGADTLAWLAPYCRTVDSIDKFLRSIGFRIARIVDEVDAAGDRMAFVETKSGIVVYAGTDGLFAKRGNRS